MFDRPVRICAATGMACLVSVPLVSCSEPEKSTARPPVSIAAPPTDPVSDPAHHPELTGVWNGFWSQSWLLDQVAQAQWQPVLSGTADGHLTDQLVQHKAADLSRGVRLYGQIQPHVIAVQVRGDQALVADCQDASHAGQADLAGHVKTVGVARNRVLGTVRRTPAGWRVSRVDYPGAGGGC